MDVEQIAMDRPKMLGLEVDGANRRGPELAAEVLGIGRELIDQRRGGSQAQVQLFHRIVVDEIELLVFVTVALAGTGIRLSQQIKLAALAGGFLGGAWNRFAPIRRFGRLLFRRL